MRYTSIPAVLGLMAVVDAAPKSLVSRTTATSVTPPTDQEFSLSMSVQGTYLSLTATLNDYGDVVLQAGQESEYPGTPVYANTTTIKTVSGFNTSIVLDLTESTTVPQGLYGLSVPDLGEVYGAAASAYASLNYQDFGFDIADDGSVWHQLTSAAQSWYACLETIGGVQNYVLSWGVYTETPVLGPPEGCVYTNVIQNFNVPGGATS